MLKSNYIKNFHCGRIARNNRVKDRFFFFFYVVKSSKKKKKNSSLKKIACKFIWDDVDGYIILRSSGYASFPLANKTKQEFQQDRSTLLHTYSVNWIIMENQRLSDSYLPRIARKQLKKSLLSWPLDY